MMADPHPSIATSRPRAPSHGGVMSPGGASSVNAETAPVLSG